MNCSCGKCVPVAILNLQIKYRTASWANVQSSSQSPNFPSTCWIQWGAEVSVLYLRLRPPALLLNWSHFCGRSEEVHLPHGDTELHFVTKEPWRQPWQMTGMKSVLIHGEKLHIIFMILVYYFPADPFREEAGISPGLWGPEQWKNVMTVVEKVMVSLLSSWIMCAASCLAHLGNWKPCNCRPLQFVLLHLKTHLIGSLSINRE